MNRQKVVETARETSGKVVGAERGVSKSARSLLLTMLGEYFYPMVQPVWTANVLHGLEMVGVAEKSARQALSRAAAAGWITRISEGRRAAWALTPSIRRNMQHGLVRVRSIAQVPEFWDGKWLIVYLSLPEEKRSVRPKLYSSLRWAGFGSAAPGLWINAHSDRIEETNRLLERLGAREDAYMFSGAAAEIRNDIDELIHKAWNYTEIGAYYDEIYSRFADIVINSEAQAFEWHFRQVHEWQHIPFIDPGLPMSLRPTQTYALESLERLNSLRNQLEGRAHAYWRQLNQVAPPK